MNITVDEAVRAFQQGEFVIIVDGKDREDEGDLALSLESATAERLADMCRWAASGLLALAFPVSRHKELDIRPAERRFQEDDTPFGESFDLCGIDEHASMWGRLKTARAIMDPRIRPQDLARPGHVFTLWGRDRGLEERLGHTEAVIELTRLAGLYPAGFLSEILHGISMARGSILEDFAKEHGIGIISIAKIKGARR